MTIIINNSYHLSIKSKNNYLIDYEHDFIAILTRWLKYYHEYSLDIRIIWKNQASTHTYFCASCGIVCYSSVNIGWSSIDAKEVSARNRCKAFQFFRSKQIQVRRWLFSLKRKLIWIWWSYSYIIITLSNILFPIIIINKYNI